MARAHWVTGLIFLLTMVLSRLIPHPPNWTAAGAFALWSAWSFGGWRLSSMGGAVQVGALGTSADQVGGCTSFAARGGSVGTSAAATCIILPLMARLATDLILGFDGSMGGVYLVVASVAMLGMVLQPSRHWSRALVGAVGASLIFFLFSNFGVWVGTDLYRHDLGGLIKCYAMALPFLGNQLGGDLAYVFLFAAVVRYVDNKGGLAHPKVC